VELAIPTAGSYIGRKFNNCSFMCKLTQNIIALPVILFLIVVLSAPALTIHHVHRIEVSEPEDHHDSAQGQGLSDVRATYHEDHVIKLQSDDSFNSSARGDVVPLIHKFIAVVLNIPVITSTSMLSVLSSANIRMPSQPSGDKCVLFCSFLI